MNKRDVQRLLAFAGYYKGGIDGIEGPLTRGATDLVLADDYPQLKSRSRRRVGAAQVILNDAGFEAGAVDGYAGHNTREAFAAWQFEQIHGKREIVARLPVSDFAPVSARDLPRQADVGAFYGQPGGEIKSRLMIVKLPFDLRLDWNLSQTTRKMRVHEKCGPSLLAAMVAVHDHYGAARMSDLGLDRYAGGYLHRKMRGGSKWSMHAYGCAVDFYARPNGLRMKCPEALFCGAEYRDFLDIMEAHGWLPAIRLWGKDAMHFQQARL